jgi:hypothetical protein
MLLQRRIKIFVTFLLAFASLMRIIAHHNREELCWGGDANGDV